MILNFISGPRNVSTALMYSFAHHPDFIVIDEPFYGYYLQESGAEHPGKEEVLQEMLTDENRIINSLPSFGHPKHLFIKNMAHHLIMVRNREFMKDMKNVFLIRDPVKLIASFSKVIEKPSMRDIGIKDEYTLFEEVLTYQEPVVIDSDELLKDPENILSQLLKNLGIPFNKNMLSWNPGPKKEDGVWAKYWYQNVHSSSGFAPYKEKKVKLTGYLQELYEQAKPYYDHLHHYIIKKK